MSREKETKKERQYLLANSLFCAKKFVKASLFNLFKKGGGDVHVRVERCLSCR